MFKLLVLATLLAVAVAHPTKKETSSAKFSEWRKDKIEKHEEPIVVKIEVPVKKEHHHHHEEIKHETHHHHEEKHQETKHESHYHHEEQKHETHHHHEEQKHETHHHEPATSSQWRHEHVKSEGKSVVFEHKHH